jgi:hypothetical protein
MVFFFFFCYFLGQYYFEGRYDLVKFVKLVGESGLYLHLRIGPYVCAEWNFGSHLSFSFFFKLKGFFFSFIYFASLVSCSFFFFSILF